jgi:hypothetical protein
MLVFPEFHVEKKGFFAPTREQPWISSITWMLWKGGYIFPADVHSKRNIMA